MRWTAPCVRGAAWFQAIFGRHGVEQCCGLDGLVYGLNSRLDRTHVLGCQRLPIAGSTVLSCQIWALAHCPTAQRCKPDQLSMDLIAQSETTPRREPIQLPTRARRQLIDKHMLRVFGSDRIPLNG